MDRYEESDQGKPKLDQEAYGFTLSQAGTSYAGSMAGTEAYRRNQEDDDAQTRVSTYSYRSDRDASKFLRQVDGRTINALTDMYYLPTDGDEWNRLDKQHTAIVLGLGGLYPAATEVRAILQPEEGRPKKVLDLGCGTGVWTTQMAQEFPECEVTGVDVAPAPINPEDLSQNCHFELDDLNLGLAHFAGEFDVVHTRLVGAGIKDFRKTLNDVALCLKPGGIALWLDIDYDLYSTDSFSYLPVASELIPSGAWLQRPIYEMRRSAVKGGSDIHTMEAVLDEGLWSDSLYDPETCKTASLYLPLGEPSNRNKPSITEDSSSVPGPWAKSDNPTQQRYLEYVGALMRQDIMSGHRAVHPLLIRSGWSKDTVNGWSDRADQELSSMKDQVSLRIRLAWGRRRAAPDQPAPPLPPLPESSSEGEFGHKSQTTFPFYYVYNSREESLEQATIRNKDKPTTVPAHPTDVQS